MLTIEARQSEAIRERIAYAITSLLYRHLDGSLFIDLVSHQLSFLKTKLVQRSWTQTTLLLRRNLYFEGNSKTGARILLQDLAGVPLICWNRLTVISDPFFNRHIGLHVAHQRPLALIRINQVPLLSTDYGAHSMHLSSTIIVSAAEKTHDACVTNTTARLNYDKSKSCMTYWKMWRATSESLAHCSSELQAVQSFSVGAQVLN
jgi:hypothetical protein